MPVLLFVLKQVIYHLHLQQLHAYEKVLSAIRSRPGAGGGNCQL
jgi:hypothetical protein